MTDPFERAQVGAASETDIMNIVSLTDMVLDGFPPTIISRYALSTVAGVIEFSLHTEPDYDELPADGSDDLTASTAATIQLFRFDGEPVSTDDLDPLASISLNEEGAPAESPIISTELPGHAFVSAVEGVIDDVLKRHVLQLSDAEVYLADYLRRFVRVVGLDDDVEWRFGERVFGQCTPFEVIKDVVDEKSNGQARIREGQFEVDDTAVTLYAAEFDSFLVLEDLTDVPRVAVMRDRGDAPFDALMIDPQYRPTYQRYSPFGNDEDKKFLDTLPPKDRESYLEAMRALASYGFTAGTASEITELLIQQVLGELDEK